MIEFKGLNFKMWDLVSKIWRNLKILISSVAVILKSWSKTADKYRLHLGNLWCRPCWWHHVTAAASTVSTVDVVFPSNSRFFTLSSRLKDTFKVPLGIVQEPQRSDKLTSYKLDKLEWGRDEAAFKDSSSAFDLFFLFLNAHRTVNIVAVSAGTQSGNNPPHWGTKEKELDRKCKQEGKELNS